jgi:hypothetical protein
MSGTFIDDMVRNIINATIVATTGSEGEGQERDAPQVMVSYQRHDKQFLIILAILAILPLAALQHSLNFLFSLWFIA